MNSIFTFRVFCYLCERLQKAKKHSEKDHLLSTYLKKYKEKINELQNNTNEKLTVYPVLRLLIPEFEKERGPYGLKETALAKLFINALCLDPQSATKLSNYKAGLNARNDNDFAGVAFWVIKRSCIEKSNLTISEVNEFLDTLASLHAEHKPNKPREVQRTLYRLTKTATATEMKWIIRIILKDMKLGMGNNRILKIFHSDAEEMYDICMDLSKVCETLHDPSKRFHELEISVFTAFRPMLSLKCDSTVFDTEVTDQRLFYVENKFDGERFQLHMKDGLFKYFSKNGYDYTNTYGRCYDSDGLITPHLKEKFKDVRSVILDGEMMGWNKRTKDFGSKGMSYDVKNLKLDSVHRPCYCVFDIVLYNDEVLTNRPLQERLKILYSLIAKDIDGVIMKSRVVEAKTKEDILNELNKSHDRKEEGICFKDPESIYKPNNRKSGWWKMKLEYFDSLMTELDVIIIGGYYGDGKRRGLVSSFLLAVAKEPENAGESPTEFYSFAKVANGFSNDELDQLVNKLRTYWKPVNKTEMPEGIFWKKEKPDLWIEPRNSIILQVKASELAKTTEFQTDYTLRFPRVEKIRFDKPWYNCMTTNELNQLTETRKPVQKLSDRHININDINPVPKKKRRKNNQISLVTLGPGEQKSNIFEDKEICIFTGNDNYDIKNLELKVLENGGKITKLPSKSTFCIVVGDITTAVHILKKNSSYDIVTLDWFLRCIDSCNEDPLEWTPNDLINMSPKTRKQMSQKYDQYGDSYTEEVTREDLERFFKRIDENDEFMNVIPQEMTNFDQQIVFQNPLSIFRMCFAYFDNFEIYSEKLENAKLDFRFYGGKICEDVENYTTHIVILSSNPNRESAIRQEFPFSNFENINFVNENWILNSISEETRLVEENFLICATESSPTQ